MFTKSLYAALGSLIIIAVLAQAPAEASIVAFSGEGSGPLELIPISGTSRIDEIIDLAYSPISGFAFDRLYITDTVDLALIDPELHLINALFNAMTSDGSGLLGTFYFTSGEFVTPTYEVFTGNFIVTQGYGAFASYTGSGTLSGQNIWSDPLHAVSTMVFTGSVSPIPEPGMGALLLLGVGVLALWTGRIARHDHKMM